MWHKRTSSVNNNGRAHSSCSTCSTESLHLVFGGYYFLFCACQLLCMFCSAMTDEGIIKENMCWLRISQDVICNSLSKILPQKIPKTSVAFKLKQALCKPLWIRSEAPAWLEHYRGQKTIQKIEGLWNLTWNLLFLSFLKDCEMFYFSSSQLSSP